MILITLMGDGPGGEGWSRLRLEDMWRPVARAAAAARLVVEAKDAHGFVVGLTGGEDPPTSPSFSLDESDGDACRSGSFFGPRIFDLRDGY